MAAAIFPDNTVLVNFAAVRRLDLLEGWLRGRGRWTEAVAFEAGRSGRYWPDLNGLRQAGWLGDPVEISNPDAVAAVERLRRVVFGGSSLEPLKHLGESQTCHLIGTDSAWKGSWWVSDDRDALGYARHQGIFTYETIDVVKFVVADGDLTARMAFDLMQEMDRVRGGGLRIPGRPADLTV